MGKIRISYDYKRDMLIANYDSRVVRGDDIIDLMADSCDCIYTGVIDDNLPDSQRRPAEKLVEDIRRWSKNLN